MVTTIQEVNFSQAVSKIRQQNMAIDGNDWRVTYIKNGQTGLELSDMVWQVTGLTKPTEQEMIDAYNLWLAEEGAEEIAQAQDKQTVSDEVESFSLERADYVLAFQLMNKLVNAYANGQNPSRDTVYSNFVSGLNGTNLETAITNYITMQTGLIDFGLGIADANKQAIMQNAISYLQSLVLVAIVKRLI